ncbi:tryptophan synthase subunit alpha, partial [Candidatus Bipolaricaulota bacterium]|nr:tryptophan synthase subunit alpha [Candidatus Bipolaricaulota bacterium]
NVAERISRVNERGEGAFIAYTMAGDPDIEMSLEYIKAISAGGADVIELGVPFSDPVADGPTIQAAANRALDSCRGLEEVFELANRAKEEIEVPLILMSYYNPILQFGKERFLETCSKSGVEGVILPDLPIEEAENYIQLARESAIETPFLATPETDGTRLEKIAGQATGFLYLVARPGTTGAREEVGELTTRTVEYVTSRVDGDLPVCVGFGLSTPEGVAEVLQAGADGAIVGSAIVRKIAAGEKPARVERFVGKLKAGTRS